VVDKPSTHEGLRELALFAGAGGGILGGKLLGWRTVCAVERDAYAAQVLAQRQNDGILEPFPIWSDVTSFDGKPWRGIVDVVSGGFPCQDLSSARTNNGGKALGLDGAKSGLWREFARIISEVRPRYAFIENSPNLANRGLDRVLCDLAAMGFDAEWGCISAQSCGANHERERIWIVAHTNDESESACSVNDEARRLSEFARSYISDADRAQREGGRLSSGIHQEHADAWGASWWASTPAIQRVDDGVAFGMDRLKHIGNGQVPIVAATAWEVLTA